MGFLNRYNYSSAVLKMYLLSQCIYFTCVFPFPATLYFYSTSFWRQKLQYESNLHSCLSLCFGLHHLLTFLSHLAKFYTYNHELAAHIVRHFAMSV